MSYSVFCQRWQVRASKRVQTGIPAETYDVALESVYGLSWQRETVNVHPHSGAQRVQC